MAANNFVMKFDEEGVATAVMQVEIEGETDVYYDLQGRRVKNPRRGLYIANGKKVMIK